MNKLLDRISIDPKVCFGKPCIKGMCIWVSSVASSVRRCLGQASSQFLFESGMEQIEG